MRQEPLAYRMAPASVEQYVGQSHLLAPGKLLRRMIDGDKLSSIILFGPPGNGKSSLAKVIAATTKLPFKRLNAVTAGVTDIKQIITDAANPLLTPEGQVILFIDEIHRFNKLQQDALLPSVEAGLVILIGATTENPYFEVNKALISRATVFQLFPLSETDILTILRRSLTSERGLAAWQAEVEETALQFIANHCNGDARIALNALELAVCSTQPDAAGTLHVTVNDVAESMQRRSTAFDATGEGHYDTISALIKSMRGSDPDATAYYLALALHGGEDIEFLARRLVICAAEDVGLANPSVLTVAVSAYQAAVAVGMPEARIPLAEAALLIATSPKSNTAYAAINAALKCVENERTGIIPMHLRNAPIKDMTKLGYSQGYLYPHDFPGGYVEQQYLPDELKNRIFYEPGNNGYEGKNIRPIINTRRSGKEAQNE